MLIKPDASQFKYEIINVTTVRIDSVDKKIEEHYDNPDDRGFITSISFGDTVITVGDEFSTEKIPSLHYNYTIKHIKKNLTKPNSYYLITHLMNRVTYYLLSVLTIDGTYLGVGTYLINAYLSENGEYLNLVYRYNKTKKYQDLEASLVLHKLYQSHFELDNQYTLFKFSIPPEFLEDVKNFLIGKYSKFSNSLKKKIAEYYKFNVNETAIQVVNKTDARRKALEELLYAGGKPIQIPKEIELDSIPEASKEVWKDKSILY